VLEFTIENVGTFIMALVTMTRAVAPRPVVTVVVAAMTEGLVRRRLRGGLGGASRDEGQGQDRKARSKQQRFQLHSPPRSIFSPLHTKF
jgi:hypothetical protein